MDTIETRLSRIQKNISLASYTTFKIGGPAKYFLVVKSKEELIEAVKIAKKCGVPFFVLGGGSNILFSDKGYSGLVAKCQMSDVRCQNNKIHAESGAIFGKVIMDSVNAGLSGLECGMGIPGTIGGAVCGNAGAYGHDISEFVESVEVFDGEKIIQLDNKQCEFGYRESIFKKNHNLIILSVIFKLQPASKEESQKIIKDVLASRKGKIPAFPSSGCFFKNIILAEHPEKFQAMIPKEKIKGGKIGTGFLIDQCGLRGKQIGGAKVSEQHGNFIVNFANATAQDILELAKFCKKAVKEKFGIDLKEETRLVGF